MPNIFQYLRSYIYFTVKCLHEPIHVHFNEKKPEDNGQSAKIWILSDGSLQIEKHGVYKNKNLKHKFESLMELMQTGVDEVEKMWLEKRGSIEYIDVVGRFNVKQND
jgi:hypothetical protein